MATQLQTVNFALSHLGHAPINNLTEATPGAVQGNLWLEQARQELLIAYPWIFATRRFRLREKELNQFERRQFIDDWLYAYLFPEECLFVQYIIEPSRTSQVYHITDTPFTIEQNPSLIPNETNRIILTNVTQAVAIYTTDIDDFTMLPPHFIQPLSILLASYIAFPLTSNLQLKQQISGLYQSTLINYTAQDANQIKGKLPQESEIIRSRESDYLNYGGLY